MSTERPVDEVIEELDKRARASAAISPYHAVELEPLEAFALLAEFERLRGALSGIVALGGNLLDDSLTDRTGPNDAARRGLMYVGARQIARAALSPAPDEESDDDLRRS